MLSDALPTNDMMTGLGAGSSTKKLVTLEGNRLAEEIIETSEYLKNWWDRWLT